MQKIFTIFFLLSFYICGQTLEDNYNLSYPSYIPLNSTFDISLITSNRFEKADSLELYILPDDQLNLISVEINTLMWESNLNFKRILLSNYSGVVYRCTVDLSDSAFLPGSFFQFIIKFKNENSLKGNIKIFGEFQRKGKILGYLNSKIKNKISEADYLSIPLSFYKVQRLAGKAFLVADDSYLNISLKENRSNNLLFEFWFKSSYPDQIFLNIKNRIIPESQYSISTNSFQILSVDSKSGSQIFSNPCFISLNNWYHLEIFFSLKDFALSFYCNGALLAKYKLNVLMEAEDLIFSFNNPGEGKSYQVDLIRIVDLNNSLTYSFNNKNFLSFTGDSSTVIAQLKIDKLELLSSFENILDIDGTGIQLLKSDAPIFAKAPELNIKVLNNSYELEWSGGDYKQADYYVLEKSLKNSEYLQVYKINAENSDEKIYSFLDQKEVSSDIVFYRIRQVDKDGSAVYSSQVKIGQGLFEPFLVEQNYPNPFNPKTSIVVDLLEDSDLKVIIYNLEGKEIERLQDGFLEKGVHKFKFDASEFPSGVYLYKVETPEFSQTKKMVLTK